MFRSHRTLRRRLALPVAAVVLALGPVLPFLDRQEGQERAVLEQEHSPATCVVGHDHGICVLAGSLRSLLSEPRPLPQPEVRVRSEPSPVRGVAPRGPVPSLVQPRAPPVSI
jgi:hypothetical protein